MGALRWPNRFRKFLQQCCKRQKVFRGTCSVPAKDQKVSRGICSISASVIFPILVFAELLQDQKVSRGICSVAAKHFQKLCAAFRALSKTFFRDTDPHSFAELAFGMCFVQIFCIVRSMYAHCEGVQIDIPSIFAPNKRDFT